MVNDFFRKDLTGCVLCGDVPGGIHALFKHAASSKHKHMVYEHNMAVQSIQNVHQQCSLRNDGFVSRREVIVCYLSERVQQADGVHGRGVFDSAALTFLQHRLTLGALGRAFQSVQGSERPKRNGQCVVCLERSSAVMFTECKHVCVCISCSVHLQSTAEDAERVPCPVCRNQSSVVPVFIS